MILGFDCETSGLWKSTLDALDPGQPHLVQLGAKLFDRQWVKRGHLNCLIKPAGWNIEVEAFKVHGISEHQCAQFGIPLAAALVVFQALAANATRIIAHHMEFDRKIITSAIYRAGGSGNWWAKKSAALLCTMEAATPICKLPGNFGEKFPSLEEAVRLLVPDHGGYSVKHDADADLDATVALYRALVERGAVREIQPFERRK